MEGECYDYDADIDELFLLAGKIISPSSMGHEEVLVIRTVEVPVQSDNYTVELYMYLLYLCMESWGFDWKGFMSVESLYLN